MDVLAWGRVDAAVGTAMRVVRVALSSVAALALVGGGAAEAATPETGAEALWAGLAAPSLPFATGKASLAPRVVARGDAFDVVGGWSAGSVAADPVDGVRIQTTAGWLGFAPVFGAGGVTSVGTRADRSARVAAGSGALVFDGFGKGVGQVVRPTVLGVETFARLDGKTGSPRGLSFRVTLPEGAWLVALDDARVAVVTRVGVDDPATPTATVARAHPIKKPPPVAVGKLVESTVDASAQLDREAWELAYAANEIAQTDAAIVEQDRGGNHHVVAVWSAGWAIDANGGRVPVRVTVGADKASVRLVVEASAATVWPVVVDPDLSGDEFNEVWRKYRLAWATELDASVADRMASDSTELPPCQPGGISGALAYCVLAFQAAIDVNERLLVHLGGNTHLP